MDTFDDMYTTNQVTAILYTLYSFGFFKQKLLQSFKEIYKVIQDQYYL